MGHAPLNQLGYGELHRLATKQANYIATLRAASAALEEEWPPEPPPWSEGLTPKEAALLGFLIQAKGRAAGVLTLMDVLPRYDHVAELRDPDNSVRVLVNRVRAKLGPQIIETVKGRGYRFGAFADPR